MTRGIYSPSGPHYATSEPFLIAEQGLVLSGHDYTPDKARAAAARWLTRYTHLSQATAEMATDHKPVSQGYWCPDEQIDVNGQATGRPIGFVSPDNDEVKEIKPVTVVALTYSMQLVEDWATGKIDLTQNGIDPESGKPVAKSLNLADKADG